MTFGYGSEGRAGGRREWQEVSVAGSEHESGKGVVDVDLPGLGYPGLG